MREVRAPNRVLWLLVLTLPLAACPRSGGGAPPAADSPSVSADGGDAASGLSIAEIAPGEGHTVALAGDGSVWTSGNGGDGQLGFEQTEIYFHGVRVEGMPPMLDVAAGTGYSIFLTEDGSLWGAGYSADERLGPTVSERLTTPAELGIDGLSDIDASTNFTLARQPDDEVVAFGVNDAGGLGHGSNTDSATPVATGVEAVQIDAGGGYSLARTRDGRVKAWGMNNYGTLGTSGVPTMSMSGAVSTSGQGFFSLSPVDVELDHVVYISAGAEHALAARDDGTVFGWGRNLQGSLAQPANNTLCPVPVQIPGLVEIVAVAAGTHLSLALDRDGTVYSWGQNTHGQLGRPAQGGHSAEPTPVPGLPPIAKIIAGTDRAYAIDRNGGGWAWGNNEYGQLLADGEGLGPPLPMVLGGAD